MMKRTILALLCITGILSVSAQDSDPPKEPSVSYGFPKEYEIGGITVTGTKHLDENILITLSGLSVGDRIIIPGEDISRAVNALWKQGLFANVKIYLTKTVGETAFLEIRLEERPRLSGFRFRGIKKSEADEIRDEINLIKGRVLTENVKMSTRYTILDFYHDKGFLNAKVNLYEKTDTSLKNSIMLIIDIDKGSKIKINEITFYGNQEIPSTRLKRLMKNTKEKSRFMVFRKDDLKKLKSDTSPAKKPFKLMGNLSPSGIYENLGDRIKFKIFTSSRYLEENLEDDKIKLIDFYNTKGYRDAYIKQDTVYRSGDNLLNIDITIDEGNKYYFRHITWKGNTKYSNEELSDVLNIEKGTIYDQSLLDTRLFMNPDGRDISSLYMDDGYLFFQVTPVEAKVEKDSIDLEIRIYEGPKATINRVTISGNTKTKEHIIRRELRTLPGNKFSRSDIIRSQREIASLGFFDAEKIQINPIPHPENGTVDIKYKVVERPSDQVELSAGWGGPTGIIGTLGISFNNFSTSSLFKRGEWGGYLPSGDGQKLSIRGQANPFFNSLNASFTEPWLGGNKPNSLSTSIFRSVQSNGISKNDEEGTRRTLTTIGAVLGIGQRLKFPDDFFTLQSSLNYQNFTLDNWFNTNFLIDSGVANNFSLRETISRNSLDQPLYPRTGSNISLSVQVTPPYSLFRPDDYYDNISAQQRYKWLEYHKWRFNAEWYTRLVGDLVLKTAAKFGFLGYYNKKTGLSPFERFEVGGDGLSNIALYGKDIIALRGYEVFEVMPSATNEGAPIFDKFTMELRYPFVLKPMSTIYGLAFVEGGNAWSKFSDFNPFDVKRSAGVGIRIFLPMFGLLGFDYGIGFDKSIPKGSKFGEYGKISVILGFEPE